jgi:hypothetical protein
MKIEDKIILRTETIELYVKSGKYWLWDFTQEMNLSMRVETKEAAFLEALRYYQKRLKKIEGEYHELQSKVDRFVEELKLEED